MPEGPAFLSSDRRRIRGPIVGAGEVVRETLIRSTGRIRPVSITLGIDIGTSGTKTIAIDESGAILSSASARIPVRPSPSRLVRTGPRICGGRPPPRPSGPSWPSRHFKPRATSSAIGLSGQMHGSVFLDAERGRSSVRRCSGTTSGPWRRPPRSSRRPAAGKGSSSLVANRALDRVHRAESSSGSATTSRPELGSRPTDPPAQGLHPLQALGDLCHGGQRRLGDPVPRRGQSALESRTPRPCSTSTPSLLAGLFREFRGLGGRECEVGAEATGLKAGTKIVGGAWRSAGRCRGEWDRPIAGVVSATMGTSGVVFAHAHRTRFRPAGAAPARLPCRARCLVRDGGRALAAGGSLPVVPQPAGTRPRSTLARALRDVDPYYQLLNDEAAMAGPGAEGLFFLPYLTGERAPYYDSDAKGCLDRTDGPPRSPPPGPERSSKVPRMRCAIAWN